MKVLQINKFLYPKGGAETYMFQLSNALKEKGIDIEFWGMEDEKNIVADTYQSFAKNISYQEKSLLKQPRHQPILCARHNRYRPHTEGTRQPPGRRVPVIRREPAPLLKDHLQP